jgi:fatty-acid desaturase
MDHYRNVIYNVIVVHVLLGIGLYYMWDPSWFIYSFIAAYVIGLLGLEIYIHRYLSHQAFSMSRPMQVVLHLLSILSLQGSFAGWASVHAVHHKHSDTEDDPHPGKDGLDTWLWLKPFYKDNKVKADIRTVKRVLSDKLAQLTDRHYFLIYWTMIAIAALISLKFVVYCLFFSVVYIFHMVSILTNIVPHRIGSVLYNTKDNSRNVWWLTFLIGSPFHNTHHAFPGYYTCSAKWWHIDVSGYLIKYLIANKPVKEIPK